MSFTAQQNHDITLAEASQMTANYRDTQTGSYIKAEHFGKDAIKAILDQTNCVGIRIYYALDDESVKKLVIVGIDSSEDDLYEGLLAEKGILCPPTCPNNDSPLNS